jgi:predicted transcriptional regulator of viral defense system
MHTVTKKIIEHRLANRIIRVPQLARVLGGSEQRRYGLVNRALKTNELIRVQRSLYLLDDRFRDYHCHPFALAQALAPGSYISFETALAYHGWIPEAVYTTASVVPGRKSKRFEHDKMGCFNFYPLAIQPGFFLELVNRYQVDGQTMLVANPCRALVDIICLRKLEWQGLGWITEGLRVEQDNKMQIV